MTHNIACCYLTHNHPHVVKEVLDEVLDYYNENGIDIYIYMIPVHLMKQKLMCIS